MKFSEIKKSTILDIQKYVIADYIYDVNKNVTATLIISDDNLYYYDFQRECSVSPGKISYLKPLSRYISEGKLSVKNALEICKMYFEKFNQENIGKPKRWEPKVSIEETIPYLKLTNNLKSKDDFELNI